MRAVHRPHLLLLLTCVAMISIGLVMVLSASSVQAFKQYGTSFSYFYRQLLGAALGTAAMVFMMRFDYRRLRDFARPLLALTIILLVAVLVPGIGTTRGGSSRWLLLGPLSVQPSEAAKLVLVIFAAHVLEGKGRSVLDPVELAVPLLPATGLVALLIMAQPDLGTTIICAGGVMAVIFLSGARMRHVNILAAAGLLMVVVLGLSQAYRRERVLSFLNPWADPLNTGYHVIQGQIALGSGGLFGVGLGASRQKWSYVPNVHTDFIYAIIGEELGLAGTLFVLLLFVFFMCLGIRIARRARDRFGFLLAGGITAWIGLQALVNMATVSGLLPITGVPLPLISFGSSSLVITMAGVGILLSVARRGRAPEPHSSSTLA
ncbi:MAG: putative lipid II flippase FtsW [Actinomycetota bacterium]|nr:putative lipid II flippase FtsW [Actinomycetota bacterium]